MDLTISYLVDALVRPKGRKFMVLEIGEAVDPVMFPLDLRFVYSGAESSGRSEGA